MIPKLRDNSLESLPHKRIPILIPTIKQRYYSSVFLFPFSFCFKDIRAIDEAVANAQIQADTDEDSDEDFDDFLRQELKAADETAVVETVENEIVGNETVVNETEVDEMVRNETELDETTVNETVGNETVGDETEGDEAGVNEFVENSHSHSQSNKRRRFSNYLGNYIPFILHCPI